ncbi:hypothetical protein [Micromonospora sp. WMMD1082]|uniref:hypothetical protein n=1 Tax=Micromonospora sp. WMMD1082 TaxID=3016104 RepID=UPI0024162534|nr:hypothetical protein [Micromonospora sp. WMMD1082]MDG4792705.1 hypothetical protein [Micromonospora sp. WMMD1082]
MALDPVPWFVGGGAEHSPEVARMVAYAALRGNEGIMGAGDMLVRALAVPGTSVRIAPGACAITCRAAGGAYQSYAGRSPSETTLAIAPTGGSARSDLIVARVEDPFMPGEPWGNPSDVKVGPYIHYRVISNVPSSTTTVAQLGLGYSAIALARIDIPASTGTITQAMVKDVRKIANPRRERHLDLIYPASTISITSASYQQLATSRPLAVPSWATYARVVVTSSGMRLNAANTFGYVRCEIGSGHAVSERTTFDENWTGNASRSTYLCGGELAVPAGIRGTNQVIRFMGTRETGSGQLQVDAGTTITVDVEWYEVPE